MNKKELIEAMSKKADMPKSAAEKALNAFIDVVTESVKKKDSVTITGFGSFTVSNRAARTGVNPLTKKPISIPARKAPVFRAGKNLKDACNK